MYDEHMYTRSNGNIPFPRLCFSTCACDWIPFFLIAHHVVVSPFALRIREHTFQQTHTYVLAAVAKGFLAIIISEKLFQRGSSLGGFLPVLLRFCVLYTELVGIFEASKDSWQNVVCVCVWWCCAAPYFFTKAFRTSFFCLKVFKTPSKKFVRSVCV